MTLNNLLDDEQLAAAGEVTMPTMLAVLERAECPILQSCTVYANIVYMNRMAKEVAPYDKELAAMLISTKHRLQNIVDDVKEQQCLELT